MRIRTELRRPIKADFYGLKLDPDRNEFDLDDCEVVETVYSLNDKDLAELITAKKVSIYQKIDDIIFHRCVTLNVKL